MPTFNITAPDGTKYRVEGPEGATEQQALEKVKAQHTTAAPEESGSGVVSGAVDFLKSIPRGVVSGFMGTASSLGQATATEMQQPEMPPVPGQQESVQQIEKNVTGELPKPQGAAGETGAAIGEVLGSPATYLGPGSLLVKAGSGAASALGSEAAGYLAKGTPLEAPFRIAGSVVGGGGTAAVTAERNLAKMAAQLPKREELQKAGSKIYDVLKKSDVRISPAGMDVLTGNIKSDLLHEGARDFPNAHGAVTLRIVDELPTSGGSITGIDAVRRALNQYKTNPAEAFYADRAIDHIDDYFSKVDPKFVMSGNPQEDAAALRYAQSLWAAHKQLETIEQGSIRGQRRAGVSGTGANRINTARQEINRILSSEKKSRGMSQEAKDKMSEIVLGTWLTNRARDIGVYAPKGVVSAGPTIAAGFAGGAPAAAAVSGTGFIAKYLGEYLTQKQIRELEQLIKSESPMGAPIAKAIAPAIAEQKAVPAVAAMRSAMTSPLAPGQ